MEGVKNWEELGGWLGVLPCSSLEDAVERFLEGEGHYQQPSWRAVIFALDGAGETYLANQIRSYGELIQGAHTYVHVHMHTCASIVFAVVT